VRVSGYGLTRLRLVAPDPPLTDGEIVLRMRREEDVPLIAEASYDPETRRRLNDEPLTPDRQRDSVSRVREQWRTGTRAPFVIADAAGDRPLGLVNVQFGEDKEVAGLAVSVFPEARGRGVASRALALAATWGLRELGLRRVFAEAAADNQASIRAIEKAGFQREGVLRAHCKTHGRRHDCVMFSLLPEDIDPPQPSGSSL
jgi:RimJ/RimL family protein N-acetyltransferase